MSRLRKLKDMLEPVAIRWVESRSEVERLERKVQQMRALLEHQTRVNEQYRPYYDGTLENWRKHTKKRIELVERLLGLPDLFAFDVPDDEIPYMLKHAGSAQHKARQAPRHFIRSEGGSVSSMTACGEELVDDMLTTRSEAEVSCEMCLEVIVTAFPVHWQLDKEGRVACGAETRAGKQDSLRMTFFAAGVSCPECRPIAMKERANILRCKRSLGGSGNEEQ